MKLRNETRTPLRKSVSSVRRAMTTFNSPDVDGRVTAVLLSLQNTFEMLLTAAPVQQRLQVFDRDTGRSIGIEGSIRQAQPHANIS